MKNIIFLIVGILISINVAASSQSGYIDISQSNIQLISNGEDSRLFINGVTMEDSVCDIKNYPVILFSNNPIAKEMYSMILAAKAAGRQINLVAGACVDLAGKGTTYPSVNSVYMK
ncbi:hypothetical protein [Microbulbifer spongiae]|uniref:DUF3718 domain-containing protein n=1 Tax=Microbulbifer spongiae TaxID=2944933 RepID=A0ABY9EHE1_9GAMM|nr:hypothetical protein [Microbulbifer sp. MI-G]WKD51119.1 hypothetical protein M8T91_06790 [Microbulbifer sp. MI-G]